MYILKKKITLTACNLIDSTRYKGSYLELLRFWGKQISKNTVYSVQKSYIVHVIDRVFSRSDRMDIKLYNILTS